MPAFYSSRGYFPDFVVIRTPKRNRPDGRAQSGNAPAHLKVDCFSGFAVLHTELVSSAARLNEYFRTHQVLGLNSYPGCYSVVVRQGGRTLVSNDLLGLCPIFYFHSDQYTFISNRNHLIVQLMISYGLARRPNVEVICTTLASSHRLLSHSFSHETVLSGVRLCPADSMLAITPQSTLEMIQKPQHYEVDNIAATQGKQAYRRLIAAGAHEIKANVTAVLESNAFSHRIVDISGGKDSRLVFGTVAALGQLARCVARVSRGPSPGDLETGTGIASRFGVPFDSLSPHQRYSRNPRFVLGFWRSMLAGVRYEVGTSLWPALWQKHGVVRLNGGCGEAYRDVWAEDQLLEKMISPSGFGRYCRPGLSAGLRRQAFDSLWKSIGLLPGENLHAKLRNHYLFFRNRLHYGMPVYNDWHGYVAFSPLQSPSLLAAARFLDRDSRMRGKAIFDVLEIIMPVLNRIPFGKGYVWPTEWGKPVSKPIGLARFDGKLKKAWEESEAARKLWSQRNSHRVDSLRKGESVHRELWRCGLTAIGELRSTDSKLAKILDQSFVSWYETSWRTSITAGAIIALKVLSIYDLCFDPQVRFLDISGHPFAERYSSGIDPTVKTILVQGC
jgi:hypothetical protein